MLSVNDISSQSFGGDHESSARRLDLAHVLNVLRQKWRVIAGLALAFLLLGIVYSVLATPRYTASTQVLIDLRATKVLDNQQAASDHPVDVGVVESQVEIIKSEDVARRVVQQLNLGKDPDFTGGSPGLVRRLISTVQRLFSSPDGKAEADQRDKTAAAIVLGNTVVKRIGLTYLIEIRYTALSPVKAAAVANGIADAYMVGELDSRYSATKRAGGWLQDRIGELRDQAARADQAVQSFKSQNNMVSTNRGLMSEQQLSDVNSQLISAKAAAAEAKAKSDRITQVLGNSKVPDASVSDALHNDVINRLRAQYLDLAARRQDFAARYGENHAAVTNLRNQMEEVSRSINNEMNRIAETYKSDYEISQARVQSLQASLTSLLNQNSNGGEARVHLKDLESSAQTYRAIYDSFLQKYSEATQQQTFPIGEVRVISPASPPTAPSAPKTILIIPGSLLAGLAFGVGLVFIRDLMKHSFESSSDIERIAGSQCLGILPVIPGRTNKGVPIDPMRFSLVAPFTRFSETLRNVKVSIDLARFSKEMKVIGITSALPGEGKSTIAANLSQITASAGHKTLLIDADLRTCSLTSSVAHDARSGLVEVLGRKQSLASAVRVDDETGLHVLPCVVAAKVRDVPGFLVSSEMQALLAAARNAYDYVFIDFAPIGPVVDVKAACRLIDGFVLAIEWGKTSQQSFSEALEAAGDVSDRVIGVVLNRADPAALKRQEAYKGKNYSNYYINDSMVA